MITLNEYGKSIQGLDWSERRQNLHHSYYSQFNNEELENLVLSEFHLTELSTAFAESFLFNELPIKRWNKLTEDVWSSISPELLEKTQAFTTKYNARVVLKATARILLERYELLNY